MTPSARGNPDNLALVFQEILTATVRLRAGRQAVSDAEGFRANMREALRTADREGRKKGYSGEEMRLAVFAAVAFLDESVLNSHNPVFAHWPRKPLQEELFGGNIAGETFFRNLDGLLRSSDSNNVADVLEIYALCLLLGYQGRYTSESRRELHSLSQMIAEKMRRIRGVRPLAPDFAPPLDSAPRAASDGVVRWLAYAACAFFVLALILFIGFKVNLNAGVSVIENLASQSKGI